MAFADAALTNPGAAFNGVLGSVPTTINATKATATGTSYAATVEADVDTNINVSPDGGGALVDSESAPADGTDYTISAPNGRIVTSFTAEITANKHVEIRFRHFWTGSDDWYWVVDTGWSTGQFWLKYYDGSYHNLDGGTGYFTDGVSYTVTIEYTGAAVSVLLDDVPTLSGNADFQTDKTLGRIRHTLATNDIELASYTAGTPGGPEEATATSYDASLNIGTKITAAAGAATATGYDATVLVPLEVVATAGAATGTGYDPVVNEGRKIAADVATVAATGYDAVVSVGTGIAAASSAVTVTGYDVGVNGAIVIPADLAVGTATGYNPTVQAETATSVQATLGVASATGYDPTLNAELDIQADVGSAVVSGYDATISGNTTIAADVATITASGLNASLTLPTIILVGPPSLIDSESQPADSTEFVCATNSGRIVFTYTTELAANKHVEIRWHQWWTGSDDYYWVLDTGWSDGQLWLKYYDGSYHNLDGDAGLLADATEYTIEISWVGADVVVKVDDVPTLSGSQDFGLTQTLGKIRHTLATNDLELTSYDSGSPAEVTVVGYEAGIGPATYYLRADGTAATKQEATSDAAAATSMSLSTHNSETFSPNDTIIVSDAGGVYRGYLSPPSSGEAPCYIKYEASGAPEICGADLVTGWVTHDTNIWKKTSFTSYITNLWVDGTLGVVKTSVGALTANGHWYNDTAADILYLYDNTGDPDLHVTPGVEANVRDRCVNADKSYIIFDGLTLTKSYYANLRHKDPGSHCIFRNCTSRYSRSGVEIGESDGSVTFTDWLFEDNDCSYNAVMGLAMCYRGQDSVIRRNRCYQNDTTYSEAYDSTAGIKLFDNTDVMRGIDIYHNDCYENGRGVAGDTGGRGCGIWVDAAHATSGSPITVHHNVSYDNKGNGLFFELCGYVYAWGNVGWGNALNTGGDDAYCPASISIKAWDIYSVNNVLVYNNTFYGGRVGLLVATYDEDTSTITDCQFKNNIFTGWTEHGLTAIGGGANVTYGSGNVYDYNCFGAESNDFIRWDNTYCDTYDAYIAASSQGDHNVEAGPALKDTANGKLYLTSASPCIDAGTNLGTTYDDGLDPNLSAAGWPDSVKTLDQDAWGTGWEVGAYVYDYADVATATATSYAATVTALEGTINIDVGAATVTGYDATVEADVDATVTATAGIATATDYAAIVNVGTSIAATACAATATTFAVTVEADIDTTVTATAGTATGTAYAATVEADVDVSVVATLGTATATGYDIGLAADLVIPCTSDAVVGAGYDASVLLEAGIAAACGSLTGTAFAATVTALADTTVTASSGTATGTAYAATVQADVDVAVIATLGTATTTDYAAVVNVGTGITATAGTATATGYDVALAADNNVTATVGAATGTGHNPAIALGSFIAADVATATATAYDPTVLAALAIPAAAGVAIATGYDATVAADLVVPVTLGVVTVTGSAAGVEAETAIAATVANAIATALNASISGATVVPATKAAATVTGYAAEIGADVTITATLSAATLAAFDALLSADVTTVATKGTVTITGCNPLVLLPIDITATLGTATATANAVAVNVGAGVGADTSAITVTAHNPTVYAPLGIDQTSTPAIIVTGLDATVFEGIINITCGTITVTARVPTVTIPFRFLIEPTITSTSIDYDIVPSSTDYGITSTSYDYDIEALA